MSWPRITTTRDRVRRIAMVSTHGYVAAVPPLGAADTGGQVVYVLELSKKLAQLGYEVDIWTRQVESQPPTEAVAPGVRILRVPCGGSAFIPKEYLHECIPEWVDNAHTRIARERLSYSVIDSHYWDAGLAGQRLSELTGIPHVHTPHSLGLWKQRQMLTDFPEDATSFERVYNFAERIRREREIMSAAALVIATTPEQVDHLSADYAVPPERLVMIPPGYDDNRFYPVGESTRELARRRFGFHGKVILSLGRMARNKGYDLLIRAFAEVAAREPDARLYLAIGGEKLGAAEARILDGCKELVRELDLSERVTFGGYVRDADMADLYRAADVFVLSSRYEPFGMTAIEAMACGTPAVVTIHGGLFRALRFGIDGLFADTFDTVDLGITLLKPLQYPALAQRLSRRGAEKVRRAFTWSCVAQQLIAATERLAPLPVRRSAAPSPSLAAGLVQH